VIRFRRRVARLAIASRRRSRAGADFSGCLHAVTTFLMRLLRPTASPAGVLAPRPTFLDPPILGAVDEPALSARPERIRATSSPRGPNGISAGLAPAAGPRFCATARSATPACQTAGAAPPSNGHLAHALRPAPVGPTTTSASSSMPAIFAQRSWPRALLSSGGPRRGKACRDSPRTPRRRIAGRLGSLTASSHYWHPVESFGCIAGWVPPLVHGTSTIEVSGAGHHARVQGRSGSSDPRARGDQVPRDHNAAADRKKRAAVTDDRLRACAI
jgi:hypothetical protein